MTTSTSSAAATGLPDRRHFLSTIAGVGALGLPALPALAAAPSQDRELLELDALLTPAHALRSDLAERCDEAYERFDPPEIPETLLWRETDFPAVWIDKRRLDRIGKGAERFTYASEGALECFKRRQAEWLTIDPASRQVDMRTVARVEEIIRALEEYQAQEARQLAICGSAAADAAHDAQCAVVDDLLARIAAIPAHTAEGVCVKVRAALAASYRDADLLEIGCVAKLLAKTDRRPPETEELLSLSAMIDASRLDRRAA